MQKKFLGADASTMDLASGLDLINSISVREYKKRTLDQFLPVESLPYRATRYL